MSFRSNNMSLKTVVKNDSKSTIVKFCNDNVLVIIKYIKLNQKFIQKEQENGFKFIISGFLTSSNFAIPHLSDVIIPDKSITITHIKVIYSKFKYSIIF